MAHPEVLRFYLERVVGGELEAFGLAETAFATLGSEQDLRAFFEGLSGTRLGDVIAALEVYEGEFPVGSAVGLCTILQNQIKRVPERPGGFLSMRPDMTVGRVVLRVLRQLAGPEEVEAVVRDVLPGVELLSDRLDLLTLVGYREGAGHELVSEEAAASLEAELRRQVHAASATTLAGERDLLHLLLWTAQTDGASERTVEVPKDDAVGAALLRSAVTETQRQSMDSRAVTRRKRLFWDSLVKVFGSEAELAAMIDHVAAAFPADSELQETIELARRYQSGWRPSDFGDD